MSDSPNGRPNGRPARAGWRDRLPRIGWLTLVWVLLWGTFTVQTVVGGVLVALVVTLLFPMPPATDPIPVRPLRVLGLVVFLAYDLVASTLGVSWQILRYGPRARGTILEVPLYSSSDRVATVLASAVTLSPGTAVLHFAPDQGVWYAYSLGPRDEAGVERARRQALDMQRRVLAAFGTPEEQARAAAGEGER
ncbi:Na+/H+ antiporter subunit E [Pseudonocardia humida]|uniref:Na+/H+ antiporter subunit E n=1 Tax=Pseudonocardia humida TaxID=2800819 RepID=A0ABT0ZUB5_9PSEU|nr:Na+/H+ antiporter subunit E [Pseudonocardia humida]MCO1654321.1 Na+/H+ antiporter subunit E [Pseudonocardia humida]